MCGGLTSFSHCALSGLGLWSSRGKAGGAGRVAVFIAIHKVPRGQ